MYDIWLIVSIILIIYIVRCFYCLLFPYIPNKVSNNNVNKTIKTMIILGSGGHTAEMLVLLKTLNRKRYQPLLYVHADTDVTSKSRMIKAETDQNNQKNIQFISIPRSREVKQSYFTSIFTTIYSFFYGIYVFLKYRPQLLIVNGPGTCVPLCITVFLLRVFFFYPCPIIFVESFCRVDTLSLTGYILYFIASKFIVMWPKLALKYKRCQYIGRLC